MSCRFAEFSEHNLQLLMFGERDAAEQEGVGFRPGVLSAFRASEFGFALALHFHALAGGGGLPVELKSAGCQTGVGFCIGAGSDDVMAHMLAGFLATGLADAGGLQSDFLHIRGPNCMVRQFNNWQ